MLLVDDHPVTRAGVRGCLEQEPDLRVVGETGEGSMAVKMVRDLRPDVIMLDVVMPGLDGFAVLDRIRWSPTRVLMFSAHSTMDYILKAMRLGAMGYLCKSSAAEEYGRAIRRIMSGRRYYSGDSQLIEHIGKLQKEPNLHPSGLSSPEIECLVWIAEGMTLAEVSERMKISLAQVRWLKSEVCRKLGFDNAALLTRYAASMGFIDINQ